MTEVTHELPERIGTYRVLQLLGQGGMGEVYEAEETGPVRRRVAIKVVKTGMDSRDVITRFEAERQALALMNHPGIAKVFHAGTTKLGAPFFTMELIRGRPITEFCDAHRLPIAKRIELFIAVCRAVQHAHQKGVIHRDLKPSNMLVTEQDGVPQPKIIDFGVAKAIGQQLTTSALVTMNGVAVGTAAYMSPEQAEPIGLDIDTRSDIYSLGVVLYELLVGQLPLEPGEGRIDAFLARLASGDATVLTPSSKLSASHTSAAVAKARNTELSRLQREVRGDIDWIVMTAMHPDRSRRYDSASSLADDLQRHLDRQPIFARPPSARYRFSRFVARHRIGVAAAAVVSASIIVGGVLAAVGLVRARSAERKAAAEAAAAQQVTGFLVDLFKVNDPGESRGNTLTALQILDLGTAKVSTGLAKQPLLQARLMQTLGTVDLQLGASSQARPLLKDALLIRERELGPNDPLVAETLRSLGEVAFNKAEYPLAESLYRRSLTIREAAFGPVNIDVASSLAGLAATRFKQGRRPEAESLYALVLPLDEKVRTAVDPQWARDVRGLATVHWGQRRYTDAERGFRRALAMQERALGGDHYDIASTLNNLGGLKYQQAKYDEALQFYERARPIYEKSLPPTHKYRVGLDNNMGEVLWKLKRYGEAEPLLRRALAAKETSFAADSTAIATTLTALAGVLRDEEKYREAEPLYRRTIDIREKFANKNPAELAETLRDYAILLERTNRVAQAAPLVARATQLAAAKAK